MTLDAGSFPEFFHCVHHQHPFPWQTELARRVVATGRWPRLIDLPTAAGKTAAIDIAVFHLACEADRGPARRAPVRMLFVIDRRIVVDAAAERARRIAEALLSATGGLLAEVAARLRLLAGQDAPPLDVVRLRGGAAQERDWARTPAQPLVVVSTVDQVGSRLLFRGYGVSPRMRPVHAGLVGADALWLLDEVHLSQPLLQTLDAIADGHPEDGRPGFLAERPRTVPFAVVRLSATPGSAVERDRFPDAGFDIRKDAPAAFLDRLTASKLATIAEVAGPPEDHYCEHACRFVRPEAPPGRRGKRRSAPAVPIPARRVAVVVNRVDMARLIHEKIKTELAKGSGGDDGPGAEVLLLTGRVRPLDRDGLLACLRQHQVFADPDRGEPERPVIVVATQTIEAGADLDFDALVTEIAPLDALRQRFGRLDRLGRRRTSQAVILHPKGRPAADNDWSPIGRIYGEAAFAAKEWLVEQARQHGGVVDFGIDAMDAAIGNAAASDPAFLSRVVAPKADAPVLLPAHVELWAMTSPAPAATPDPGLFLHGPQTDFDVQVVWRAGIVPEDEEGANVVLGRCPPSSLEAMPVPVWAVRRWLAGDMPASFADTSEKTPTDGPAGGDKKGPCLRRTEDGWKKIEFDDIGPGDTIVVPCSYGGCDRFGWSPECRTEVTDLGAKAHYLQRLKGALFVSRASLANALAAEGRGEEGAELWPSVRSALAEVDDGDGDGLCERLSGLAGLPETWLALIQAMGPRGPRLDWVRPADHTAGAVIWAERRLDRGLFTLAATEEEAAGPEAITDRADSWRIGRPVALLAHLGHAAETARRFARSAGLDDRMVELVGLAAWLHDLGKADPRFQADLRGMGALFRLGLVGTDGPGLLAKSGRKAGWRGVQATPDGFRHEALSVALAERHPALAALDEPERDLVLWLIGTHHGFGRPFFPPLDDPAPDSEARVEIDGAVLRARAAEAPVRLDQGWFERAERLRRRFGPWELARLEAIVRLADHATSAAEERGAYDKDGGPAAALEEAAS